MRKNLEGFDNEDIYILNNFTEEGVKKYNISYGPHKDVVTQREIDLLLQSPTDGFSTKDKAVVYDAISRAGRNSNIALAGFTLQESVDFHEYFHNIEPLGRSDIGLPGVPHEEIKSFFAAPSKNETILQKIKDKNKAGGFDSNVIPGTEIEIINFSQCPKCEQIYSLKELNDYYASPAPVKDLKPTEVMRRDTRFQCPECKTFFKPKLVIVDGYPKAEVQYLCRLQTTEAIETFYRTKLHRPVLTQKSSNFQWLKSHKSYQLQIDIKLNEIAERPELVASFLRHTPPAGIMPITSGNTQGLTLFGELLAKNKKISH